MVYYRKYRPQKIQDLDSTLIREKISALLANALRNNGQLQHAFLFTGPKGLGKTSTARLISKAINCERNGFAQQVQLENDKKQEAKIRKSENTTSETKDQTSSANDQIEPCNQCPQCMSITNGTNLDVMEIDAASNRGIDEIRELREKINLSPVQSRKKIYIIDEVHMLTSEAFNALLKTLEEPPAHAIFILCTTEEQKVPVTIISRCFHIHFVSANSTELARSLLRIVTGEGIKITDDGLSMIAKYAQGGFRDGAKLLEEAVLLANTSEITVDLLREKLNIGDMDISINEFLNLLQSKNENSCLDYVEKLIMQKKDLIYFQQELLSQLHRIFLDTIEKLTKAKEQPIFSQDEITELVKLISISYKETKQAYIIQLPLELAIVRWCNRNKAATNPASVNISGQGQTTKVSEIKTAEKLSDQSKVIQQIQKEADGEVTVGNLRKQVGAIAKIKALYGENKEEVAKLASQADAAISVSTDGVSLLHFSADGEITQEWLDAYWRSIIFEMKKYNHTIAGVLRSCRIKSFDRKSLVIEAAYKFHKDKISEGKTIINLEEVCKALVGSPVAVSIVLAEKK